MAAFETERPERTLILPFQPMSPAPELAWIGPAIQQSLLSDLSGLPDGVVQSAASAIISDDALKTAKESQARYVVFGSYQSIDDLLRLTGQVWDVRETKPIAGLKVTGEAHDIFAMEDELAAQIKRAVSQAHHVAPANPLAHAGPTAADLAIQSSGPLRLSVAPETPDAAITYAQPYPYSSQAAQGGDWRYVYGGSPSCSFYYGCGFGYYPCYGLGCGGSFGGFRYCGLGAGFGSSGSSFGRGSFASPGRSFTSPNGGAGPVASDRAHGHGGHR